MLRLCVIGAGNHSRLLHLPALSWYLELHPLSIAVVGICDLVAGRAEEAASLFGGCQAYSDLATMLAAERPDACLALTPVIANGPVAIGLLQAGIPVLMEKPLGATLAEAKEVVRVSQATQGRIMVSMNRRFDPLLAKTRAWIGHRPVRYIRATMARHNRTEAAFLEETGLHLIDVIRSVAGEIASWDAWENGVDRSGWTQLRLEFTSGAKGLLDILPTAGGNGEFIELFGDGFRAEVRNSEFDDNLWRAWTDGRLVCSESSPVDTPEFIANGTYAETEAFLTALRDHQPFGPTPSEVLPSMELCHAIRARLENA